MDTLTVIDESTEADIDEPIYIYITWDHIVYLDKVTLEKGQKECNDLKPLYKVNETVKPEVALKAY